MSSLEENQCYGLAGGGPPTPSSGGGVSVFHVKLTDSAARAIDTFHNSTSGQCQPAIRFAGDQGRITVPCSDNGEDNRTFTFVLTNMVRHIPHGSFDCVRQLATSTAGGQLSRVGLIQRRLTVNATDDSYQKAWQNMAQAEEETRKRAAIVIKDGRVRKKRVTVRAPAPALVSLARPCHANRTLLGGNQRRRSGAAGGRSARAGVGVDGVEVEKRPIRERLVHLLAVRPYRRPELILRLRKDGLTDGEKGSLDALLLEVGQLNSRDHTLVLKDRLYTELQKDWPGYSPGDQQVLRRILVRRLFKPHKNLLSVPETQVSPLRDTPNSSPARPHKHSLMEEHTQSTTPANKKPRVSRIYSGRVVTVTTGDRPPPRKHPARSDDRLEAGGDVTATTEDDKKNNNNNNNRRGNSLDPRRLSDSLSAVYTQQEKEEVSERLRPDCSSSSSSSIPCSSPRPRESPAPLPQPGPPPPVTAAPLPGGPQTDRRVKKRRKSGHREQEKVRSREKKERTGDSDPGDRKGKVASDCADTNGALRDSGVLRAAGDPTDYLSAYTVIRGHEQRLSYKQDFNEEYSEYRGLHARIDGVTQQFLKLNTQLKQLRHGSSKYKTIRNLILQEYRKIKKSNPNYNQDKTHCEYLHNKLAHIKKLISVYDQRQFSVDSK